jgi:hypothetical protein
MSGDCGHGWGYHRDGPGGPCYKCEEEESMSIYDHGHDKPCYYCKKPINIFASNPREGCPVPLMHRDEPGKMKWHHMACVTDRLIENQFGVLNPPFTEPVESKEYTAELVRLLNQRYTDTGDTLARKAASIIEDALLRETCPDCGRNKARDVNDVSAGDCPKWWAIRDSEADVDCQRYIRKIAIKQLED